MNILAIAALAVAAAGFYATTRFVRYEPPLPHSAQQISSGNFGGGLGVAFGGVFGFGMSTAVGLYGLKLLMP